MEVLKPLDNFLNDNMFLGFIFDSSIGTALIGAEPNNPIVSKMLDTLLTDYATTHRLTVSNDWVTKFFLENFSDFRLNGKLQKLASGVSVYPKDYFEKYKVNKDSRGDTPFTTVRAVGTLQRTTHDIN